MTLCVYKCVLYLMVESCVGLTIYVTHDQVGLGMILFLAILSVVILYRLHYLFININSCISAWLANNFDCRYGFS